MICNTIILWSPFCFIKKLYARIYSKTILMIFIKRVYIFNSQTRSGSDNKASFTIMDIFIFYKIFISIFISKKFMINIP